MSERESLIAARKCEPCKIELRADEKIGKRMGDPDGFFCSDAKCPLMQDGAGLVDARNARLFESGVPWISNPVPPMPEGFTDRAAWDAIHWRFSVEGSVLDEAVLGWQRENQERVKAAAEAAGRG